MSPRTQFDLYKQIILKKNFKMSSIQIYRLLCSKRSFGNLLRYINTYLNKYPNSVIHLTTLIRKQKVGGIKSIHDLTSSQQLKLINCLNYWGHHVKVKPLSADFGFTYMLNLAIWELKSKDVSARRYLELLENSNSSTSFMYKEICKPYICPAHLLGLSPSGCTIYGRSARTPHKPSNSLWKQSNENGTNACLGPTTLHFASKYYWQRLKEYVKIRGIFWYWIGIVIQRNCTIDGKYRQADVDEYKRDFIDVL